MSASGPVLALKPDALDTQDALDLWALFSKSKDSLLGGPRLEYISWRLSFQQLSRNGRVQTPLDGPWPPTPESVCSEDMGGSKSAHSAATTHKSAVSLPPFFRIQPRPPMPTTARPAGRIMRDMVSPDFPPKPIQQQEDTKKQPQKGAYPTPASSSSSDSASSSRVSIAVSPAAHDCLEPVAPVPRVHIVNATPNLTPHPTPPATPLLAASTPAPPRTLSPSTSGRLSAPSSPTAGSQTRRDPPGQFFLPRSATRGMGSPVFPPADSAYTRVDPSAYAPKSTHNLPIGGLRPLATETAAKATPRGKFYLEPGPSGSSHSSSRSSNSYRDGEEHGSDSPSSRSGSGSGGSESSRERGEGSSSSVNSHPRGVGSARGRGRERAGSSGRRSPDSREFQRPEMHEQPPKPEQAPQPPPAKQLQPQEQRPQSQPKPAPFLGRLGAGLEMTASPQSNGVDLDRDDARSVSSLTTSSSNVRVRVRGKQPARPPMRSQHSRSRSRKGGTRPGHAREGSAAQREAPNALGLPSELTAATALVERHMRTEGRSRVMVASDEEEGEWTDYEYESGVDGASAEGGEEEEEEVDEGDEEDGGWEDEDESESAQEVATNAKAPPPSLQQQQPGPHLGHARGHSTGGNDLRQLPSLRRSAGHLPALAAPTKHQHTASAQNARTARALNATMSATTLSSAMHEAQRQRELFAKAPRHSYENLTSLGAHPSGLTLLLGGRPQQVAEQYHQQQHQLQQQIEGRLPPPRQSRPGGLAGLGLMMTARPPTGAGGSELSPIPPTPASAALQPHHQQPPAVRQQSQLPPTPPPPQQKPPTPAQAGLLPRRPNMPRAMSTPHFGTPGTSGSVGKSAVAGPVVSGVGEGPEIVATPVLGPSTTTPQNGSASRSGYRPKGPPAGMEYDDEEDDESDAEGRGISKGKGRAHDEGIFSKSVAQEKLRVLAEKSAISSRAKNGGANGVETGESERRRLFEQADDVPWAAAPKNPNASDDYVPQRPSNQSMSSGPVGFPYHLPVPAPPSTPRTTRQHMMRNEMSESLRLNLLWQRKTYRSDMTGPPPRRTKSTVNVTTVQGGRQPEKSLVRVTPRAPGAERRDATLPPMDPPVPAGAPKKKLVRNYSMGDTSTYHYAGW